MSSEAGIATPTSTPSAVSTDVTASTTSTDMPGTQGSRSTAQRILFFLNTPTKKARLSTLNLDRYIAHHRNEPKDSDAHHWVQRTLICGATTIDLPVSEADELNSDHQRFSDLLETMEEKERSTILRQQAAHLCDQSFAAGILNKKNADRVRKAAAESCSGYNGSGEFPVSSGYKDVPLTIFNVDAFLTMRDELSGNEDELNQELISAILSGEVVSQPFPEHVADVLLKRHNDLSQAVKSISELRGEEEAVRCIDERLTALESMRQAWLGGTLRQSGPSMKLPSVEDENSKPQSSDSSVDAPSPDTPGEQDTGSTRKMRLSVLNLDKFVERHQTDAKQPALHNSVLETLVKGSSTIELPVTEADELDRQAKELSEVLGSLDETEANEALRKRIKGLFELSIATGFLDEETMSKVMGNAGGGRGTRRSSGESDGNTLSEAPGHKVVPITLLNLDSFLPLPEVLKMNENQTIQTAISEVFSGKSFKTELPDQIAESLLSRHNDRVKEVQWLKETKGEKEVESWFNDRLSTMESMRQDWLGGRLAPSEIPLKPPPKVDSSFTPTPKAGETSPRETGPSIGPPASASDSHTMASDLVDTEFSFTNFDTFFKAYWPENKVCSEATTDYLFAKYHPTKNRQFLEESYKVWAAGGQEGAKVSVPSDLAAAMKKRDEEVSASFSNISTKSRVEASEKWRMGLMFHQWKKWKDTYKWSNAGPLSASSTSIPNISRRPVSRFASEIASLDEDQVREIVDYALNPSVKELSEDEFQLAREAFKRSDGGFGKQGLRPEHLDALNRKRKLAWKDLQEDDGYKMLRTACGSSVRREFSASSDEMPSAAPAA
ncbi:hypothetical protein I316_01287 [Kwoniella heveanensis BCC8398]|uniref:Uncharacterized protein n=1 Tax=Kwoniella heveanensis BCC8398 TaxID=1296120 RepID=A0A1B9H089_9TREE|nr:hypothetical protein I316_01287 [Kwoniella heveanensis BCC8398]